MLLTTSDVGCSSLNTYAVFNSGSIANRFSAYLVEIKEQDCNKCGLAFQISPG